jgi:CRP-like cAMP-binding protein
MFQNHNEKSLVPFVHSPEELQHSLSLLSISGLSHFELDDMFEEASNCLEVSSQLPIKSGFSGHSAVLSNETGPQARISVVSLIAGSDSFRNHLIKLKTDPIFCSLMQSSLASFISPQNIRELALGGKEFEITRLGTVVYTSRECKKCIWYILISGKLKVTLDTQSQGREAKDVPHCELNSGEIFGGYGILPSSPDTVHVKIETMQASKFIELSGERLNELVNRIPETGERLMSMMAGDNLTRSISISGGNSRCFTS